MKLLKLFSVILLAACWGSAQEPPREWIDKDTGHRVLRLSDEPGTASLYFHQNAYTPDGKKILVTTPTGLATIDLQTRKIEKIVEGRVNVIIAGYKTGQVYYLKTERDGTNPPTRTVWAVDPKTKATRKIGVLPPRANLATVNSDETLLAGTIDDGPPQPPPDPNARPRGDAYPGKGEMMERRLAEKRPLRIITFDARTGEVKTLHQGTDWFNHFQFSPTDPTLLMFCHEGPWHKVDRTWTIHTDGTGLTQIHPRTMNMEIAGHEFFSADGQWIWYDLQTPRSQVFWLAGLNLKTGQRIWYNLAKSEWSVHFNVSPDGKLFAGDGGGPSSVAAPDNGQWIYLFRPELNPDRTAGTMPKSLITPGYFKAEKLVNLSKHNYNLEPNVTFTPDMKWIVFRSNMFGPTHVFAVELEKAK